MILANLRRRNSYFSSEIMSNNPFRIFMLAAHGGSNSNALPLGGGAAVCEQLVRQWGEVTNLDLTLLAPGPLKNAEIHEDLIDQSTPGHPRATVRLVRLPIFTPGEYPNNLSTLRYASFCRQFEKLCTDYVLKQRPDVVLTHDISEGPNFTQLKKSGIPCVPIFHVDVADFFCRMYLNEIFTPRQCQELFLKLHRSILCPDLIHLAFGKQYDAIQTCPKLIVPSQGMKEIMLETYDNTKNLDERIEVIPWGAPLPQFSRAEVEDAIFQINSEFSLEPDDPVIVMLSRISPEKAQHKLIEALAWGEELGMTVPHLKVIICGEAAYMGGERFFRKLKTKAGKLHKTEVIFPGHVGGLKKAAILARANIFVSTSRHESYGLTTMEAMSEGTPAIAIDTPGARQTIIKKTGLIISRQEPIAPELWKNIYSVLTNKSYNHMLSEEAKRWATYENFAKAAERILKVMEGVRFKID